MMFYDYPEIINIKSKMVTNSQLMAKVLLTIGMIFEIRSYNLNKVSLSCFDDNGYIQKDGISSLTCGHYIVKN